MVVALHHIPHFNSNINQRTEMEVYYAENQSSRDLSRYLQN